MQGIDYVNKQHEKSVLTYGVLAAKIVKNKSKARLSSGVARQTGASWNSYEVIAAYPRGPATTSHARLAKTFYGFLTIRDTIPQYTASLICSTCLYRPSWPSGKCCVLVGGSFGSATEHLPHAEPTPTPDGRIARAQSCRSVPQLAGSSATAYPLQAVSPCPSIPC